MAPKFSLLGVLATLWPALKKGFSDIKLMEWLLTSPYIIQSSVMKISGKQ